MKLNWRARNVVALAGVAAGGLFTGCSDDGPESFAGVVSYGDFPESAAGADHTDDLGFARAFVLSAGFANGAAVQYLDLGEFNTVPAKVYILTKGGTPIAGQYPIVDTLPDDAEYSPYWQIVNVAVTGSYKANDVKSLKGIEDAGWDMTETDQALHCPVVNPDAAWVAADFSTNYTVFWGTGEEIPNPYYDPSAPTDDVNKPTLTDADATAGDIVLTPLWQKRMRAFCWSDDLARRYPIVEGEIDTSTAGARYDTYSVGFGPGGELGANPTDLLPVFSANRDDADYSPFVLSYFVQSLDGAQPGSVADFDPDEVASAEPEALLDQPIVFPLALDRFLVTIESAGTDTLGAGFAIVEDGSAPLWFEGEAAPTALVDYVESGDASALFAGWTVAGRPFSPIDVQPTPVVPAGPEPGSASFVVLASPFVPLFSSVHRLIERGGFTGVSEAPLYDESFEAIAEQTLDLMAYIVDAELEDPESGETLIVVGPNPAIEEPVGTITFELITPGGAQ